MTPLTCLALAAFFESREHYQTPDAMAAVVAVVQNRVEDERYADTACGVVFADNQFPWASIVDKTATKPETNGAPDEWAWDAAVAVAEDALAGNGLDITSTHFRTDGKPQFWESSYQFDGCIGGNCFFTNDTPWK